MFWKKKKDKKKTEISMPGMFRLEFLYAEKPSIDIDNIILKLAEKVGKIDLLSNNDASTGIAVTEYTVKYENNVIMPIQILILKNLSEFKLEDYIEDLQQTFDWPTIKDVITKCRYRIAVTDFMATGLEPKRRIELFNHIITLFISETNCDALYMPLSKCFINPATFIEYKKNNVSNYGFFNIRFYNVQDSDGDMVMDSLGLANFFLPDIQCHFKNLEPSIMATKMFGIANYILDEGNVIEDGNTIQGIQKEDKWYCRHEDSLLLPKRLVIDINPGKPYVAGKR